MKKVYLTFISGLLATASAFSQNTFPSSGNVGVGTTNPQYLFHVFGGQAGLQSLAIGYGTSPGVITTDANKPLSLRIANVPAMTIYQNLSVGIGTEYPQSLTEIRKNAYAAQGPVLELTNGGTGEGATSELFFSTYQRDNANPSARIKVADNGDWGGDMYFETKGTAGDAPMYTRMFIDAASGNVGIGTTSPDQLLTVNGTLHTRHVIVDLNVPAPDFVFDRKYKLMPLNALSRYIVVNKHLPEVPPAQQMEQKGVNLAEMNMKLLQKVEELTLYLLEQQKQLNKEQHLNVQQVAQMRQLQAQIKKLSSKLR